MTVEPLEMTESDRRFTPFRPYDQLFFPDGIKKTREIVNRIPSAKEKKTVLKPRAGSELRWRITVIIEMPSAPPMDRNIPRSPVIVATWSGINSMQALFEEGKINPMPIPAIMTIRMTVPTVPICNPTNLVR